MTYYQVKPEYDGKTLYKSVGIVVIETVIESLTAII